MKVMNCCGMLGFQNGQDGPISLTRLPIGPKSKHRLLAENHFGIRVRPSQTGDASGTEVESCDIIHEDSMADGRAFIKMRCWALRECWNLPFHGVSCRTIYKARIDPNYP